MLRSNLTPTRARTYRGGLLAAFALGSLVLGYVSAQASPTPPRDSNHSPQRASSPGPSSTPPALDTSLAKQRTMAAAPTLRLAAGRNARRLSRGVAPAHGPVSRAKRATRPKPTAKVATSQPRSKSQKSSAPTPPPPASPAVSDPSLLQAAGINVGPYAALVGTLTAEELLHYIEAERRATQVLLQNTRSRVQNGSGATAELVPLETKAAQLDILVHAAERLAQRPPATRRGGLYAALSPAELVQFLRTELQGARSLRDLAQARYQAGITPNTELLPLEARAQQLEILVRAAERRMVKPE